MVRDHRPSLNLAAFFVHQAYELFYDGHCQIFVSWSMFHSLQFHRQLLPDIPNWGTVLADSNPHFKFRPIPDAPTPQSRSSISAKACFIIYKVVSFIHIFPNIATCLKCVQPINWHPTNSFAICAYTHPFTCAPTHERLLYRITGDYVHSSLAGTHLPFTAVSMFADTLKPWYSANFWSPSP